MRRLSICFLSLSENVFASPRISSSIVKRNSTASLNFLHGSPSGEPTDTKPPQPFSVFPSTVLIGLSCDKTSHTCSGSNSSLECDFAHRCAACQAMVLGDSSGSAIRRLDHSMLSVNSCPQFFSTLPKHEIAGKPWVSAHFGQFCAHLLSVLYP